MKNIEELRESAIERIFLVPVSEDGELHYCWCDDPAPSEGMVASEAVEYVRADVVQMLRGQLEETRLERDFFQSVAIESQGWDWLSAEESLTDDGKFDIAEMQHLHEKARGES